MVLHFSGILGLFNLHFIVNIINILFQKIYNINIILKVGNISVYSPNDPESLMKSSTSIVEGVGLVLFGTYHVVVIIVLINMLIAMMSHSFEDIQVSGYVFSCTANVYKLDAYAGARGFNPEFRQYASRVSGPCGLTVV